jgi:hypothetical protein
MTTISEFVTQVSARGLARQNRFEVVIPNLYGDSRLVSLFCQGGSLPGATIAVKKQTLFGPAYIRPGNINYGETLQLSFLCDKDMSIKKTFDTWIHTVINPSSFTVNYKEDYSRDITIYQLDEKENYTYSVTLIDAFPVAMGALSLNQAALDRFHILPVTFAYRYWQTLDISNSDTYNPFIEGPQEKLRQQKTTQPQIKPVSQDNPLDPANLASSTPGTIAPGGSSSNLSFAP